MLKMPLLSRTSRQLFITINRLSVWEFKFLMPMTLNSLQSKRLTSTSAVSKVFLHLNH